MSEVEKKVLTFAKKASSVSQSRKVAYVVTRSQMIELNKSIDPIIKQNARERKESFESASKVILK